MVSLRTDLTQLPDSATLAKWEILAREGKLKDPDPNELVLLLSAAVERVGDLEMANEHLTAELVDKEREVDKLSDDLTELRRPREVVDHPEGEEDNYFGEDE